ncbi:BatD family protein [Vibrio sp. HN007]|uniref:BatD family protein n=1 Tax=Vibrio iocasae TaxID=3098914 RepID=UPI0035D4598F
MYKFLTYLVLTLIASFVTPNAIAQDINTLIDSNRLKIKSWLSTKENNGEHVAINQQVILYVDISTNRWFNRGTEFGYIEVPNLVVPPQSSQATNYTERKGAQTWSHQRWEIRLFPQKSGQYTIPSIPVSVQVSTEKGNVAGVIYTEPQKFNVGLPDSSLTQDSIWFTSTSATVTQKVELSSKQLQVGDVITRKIDISAKDTLSMLLPNPIKPIKNQNVSSYTEPYKLSDSVNRGEYASTRSDSVTYIMRTGGEVKLPDILIHWWDTENHTLHSTLLKGGNYKIRHTIKSFIKQNWAWITALFLGILLSIFAVLRVKIFYKNRPTPESHQFYQALSNKNWGRVRTLLYRRLRSTTGLLVMKGSIAKEYQCSHSSIVQSKDINRSSSIKIWRALSERRTRWLTIPKAIPSLEKIKQNYSPD